MGGGSNHATPSPQHVLGSGLEVTIDDAHRVEHSQNSTLLIGARRSNALGTL